MVWMKSVAVSQCLCHLFDHSDVILRCHHWCVSVQNVWALLMKWVGRLRPTKTRGRSGESMEVPQHKQVTHTLLLCCSSLCCGLDPVFQPGPTRSEGVRRKRGEDRVQHLWRGGGGGLITNSRWKEQWSQEKQASLIQTLILWSFKEDSWIGWRFLKT